MEEAAISGGLVRVEVEALVEEAVELTADELALLARLFFSFFLLALGSRMARRVAARLSGGRTEAEEVL